MAFPANLTPDKDTGLGDWDAATIKTAILMGKDDEGQQLCSVMPLFNKANMTDVEATDIVAYLKSLPAVKKVIPESKCADGAAGGSGSSGVVGK
jgi:mono/diheme cytochrome c family protein